MRVNQRLAAGKALWRHVRGWFNPRTRRRLAIIVVALVGAWFGLLVGSSVTAPVGPVDARLSLSLSLTGNTFIDVAPLGTMEFDTTDSPLALNASVASVRVDDARKIFRDKHGLDHIEDDVAGDLKRALLELAAKSLGFAVAGSALFTAAVFRTWRRIAIGCAVSLVAVLLSYGLMAVTWNAKAVEQPKYTGVLASAPRLVGSATTIASDFGKYRTQLAKLVGNLTKLYDATAKLPLSEPDPRTIRVMHVSDIHNNPAAYNVIESVRKQFGVTMIVDTGDLTDQGTAPENSAITKHIGALKIPYVFVKGNHDSESTVDAVKAQKNAVVLEGKPKTVDGIRFWGIGDPRFQPDELFYTVASDDNMAAYGQQLRPQVDAAGTLDIALTHDPNVARQWDGLAPLTLSGHWHKRENILQPGGTRAMTVGSTGGSGLRAVKNKEPSPIQLDVLYLDRRTHRLQAWDEITLGGVGQTSAELDRHSEEQPNRPLNRLAGQSPTPIPTPTPSGTETPFTVPPSTPPDSTPSTTRKRAARRRRSPADP